MTVKSYVGVSLALLVAFSAFGVAAPVDGATAADATRIENCTTITDPGRYELASDLGGDAASDKRACIVIRSGNVTLDGNGHAVGAADSDSVFVGTAVPFSDSAEYLPNVTIRDTIVTGDVSLYRAPGATVRNVTTRNTDTALLSLSESNRSRVVNSTFSGTTQRGAGIHLDQSHRATLANNTVTNTDAHVRGSAMSVSHSDGATVRGNRIHSSYVGIDLDSANDSTVSNNTVRGSEEAAIRVSDESHGNLVADTVVESDADTDGNATTNGTATTVLDMRDAGPNRIERLRVDSDATVSLSGRNVVLRDVDAPPSVPSDLAAVGGFVRVVQYRGANASLGMRYDEAAVENESAIRLYRHPDGPSPSHVYAPMIPENETEAVGDWEPVPGSNRVNATANRVSAEVPEFDFGDPDTPSNARRIEVGETANGTLSSDEVDWFAFEATAGEAILPRLEARGSIDGSLRFAIFGPNGSEITAYTNENPLYYYYGIGKMSEGREARGAAVARTNGTHYVRVTEVDWGERGGGPSPYAVTVQTEQIDSFEPNQRRETATRLRPNVTLTSTTAGYDADWYALRATEGSSINVTAELGNTTNASLSIALLGPDGEELDSVEYWSQWSEERATLNATASQDGTYYVRIGQAPDSLVLFGQGPYELTANVSSACPHRTAENTTRA